MGMQLNGGHINSAVNVSSMNNINKLAQNIAQTSATHFGAPDYAGLMSPFNINSHMNAFSPMNSPYSHRPFPYANSLPSIISDPHMRRSVNLNNLNTHNGMLPMNLAGDGYNHNVPLEQMKKYHIPNQNKEQDMNTRTMPINIPQIYPKGYPRYSHQDISANIPSVPANSPVSANSPYTNYASEIRSYDLTRSETPLCEAETSVEQNVEKSIQNASQALDNDINLKIERVTDNKRESEKDEEESIMLKIYHDVDRPTWTDTDYMNPFTKDMNGWMDDDLDGDNYILIGGEDSYNAARDIIQKDDIIEGRRQRAFQCPQCLLLFKHPKRLIIHTKWHNIAKQAEVRTKPRERKPREQKSDNSEYALEKGSFPCVDCNKKFITRKSLRNHRGKYHSGLPKECKMCHKVLPNYKSLRDHVKSEHTDEKNFKCSYCSKTFKVAHSLQKHQDTHLEKIFECQQCSKKFGSELLLTIHLKGHEKMSKGTTYHCSYCGKGFYHSYNLQVHERTHRNERPFACTICNSTYGTNSGLQRHLKVSHNTNKPWECNVCHRSFSTESIRDRHEIRIHGNPEDLKFPCNFCPSRYMSAKDLGKHYNKCFACFPRAGNFMKPSGNSSFRVSCVWLSYLGSFTAIPVSLAPFGPRPLLVLGAAAAVVPGHGMRARGALPVVSVHCVSLKVIKKNLFALLRLYRAARPHLLLVRTLAGLAPRLGRKKASVGLARRPRRRRRNRIAPASARTVSSSQHVCLSDRARGSSKCRSNSDVSFSLVKGKNKKAVRKVLKKTILFNPSTVNDMDVDVAQAASPNPQVPPSQSAQGPATTSMQVATDRAFPRLSAKPAIPPKAK
ncbi:Zinc finger protein 37 homolog [Eumeta japonica]|uniref:Zinc finger protein 37 homolog n=1 Tax=Eumeta variegata TaxID=151549 RepID=A0A4C1UWY3_EUMVA|nr:Zinc finger protein 37 homolog [Eumeta japonica]